jgi:ribosomal protein L16/L10AE
MSGPTPHIYRATIRYQREIQQHEIMELRAPDLREALREAIAHFPLEVIDTADLIEIRLANPAESGPT